MSKWMFVPDFPPRPIAPPGKWSFAILTPPYCLCCLDYGCVSGRSAETPTYVGFTNHFNISPTTKPAEMGSSERAKCTRSYAAAHWSS